MRRPGVVISIAWSTGARFKTGGISDTLNPGVFSSYGSSKVLSHEENTPVFVLSTSFTSRSAENPALNPLATVANLR